MRTVHGAGLKIIYVLVLAWLGCFPDAGAAQETSGQDNAGIVIQPYETAPAGYLETLTKDDVHPGTVVDVSTGAVVPACIVNLQVRPLRTGETVSYDTNGQPKVAVSLAIGTIEIAMGDIYYVVDPFTCTLLWHARPYQKPNS